MHNTPYGKWLPWDASDAQGAQIDGLIGIIHWFMILLFVGWGLFFLYCLLRFRARPGHAATYELPKGKVSKYLEVAIGVFEGVLLLGFSMPVWAAYKNQPPPADKRVEIDVVGQQFQWNFHYPGKDGKFGRRKLELVNASLGNVLGLDPDDPASADDIVDPELHIPVGEDIYVRISSKDVIHSFDLPVVRVKQDAIPGVVIPVWFKVKTDMTTARFREAMAKTYQTDGDEFKALTLKGKLVSMQEVKGASGDVIVHTGDLFSDDQLAKMKSAGVTEIRAAPGVATEVVCAQLCGNQHFKMHAPLVMQTPAEFLKWQEEKLHPKPSHTGEQEFQQ